jgi:hypothetical protein
MGRVIIVYKLLAKRILRKRPLERLGHCYDDNIKTFLRKFDIINQSIQNRFQ